MYRRNIVYHQKNNEQLTIRQLLKKWLIPKKWQHFLRIEKNVLIDGKYLSFNNLVQDGQTVSLLFDFPPRTTDQVYLPGKRRIDVAYEDNDILVVNKPEGIKTHPNLKTENDTLFNDAQSYLSPDQPYMVHRIDMMTSGLVLIAKSPYLVPIFNRELTTKTLQRNYLAVVRLLKPSQKLGTIDQPIGLDPSDKRKRMVTAEGADAISHFKTISENGNYALIQVKLETGRTHQIRVHLSNQGWPIVNDPLYDPQATAGKMLLCANELTFQRPFTNKFINVQIKPSLAIQNFVKKFDLKEI